MLTMTCLSSALAAQEQSSTLVLYAKIARQITL